MDAQKLTLKNFKGVDELVVEFTQPLTVLVGANGVGKTSVLQALHALGRLSRPPAGQFPSHVFEALGGRDSIPSWMRDPLKKAVIEFTTSTRSAVRLEFWRETLLAKFQLFVTSNGTTEKMFTQDDNDVSANVRGQLELVRSVFLRPEFSAMTATVEAPTGIPALTDIGGNLAVVLGSMMLSSRRKFDQLVNLLRKIVPSVDDVLAEPTRMPNGAPGQTLFVVFDGKKVPASHVSEGTIIALCILAAVLGPQEANLILLDDLDRALHPRAQKTLVECVRETISSLPQLRLVCTTHSPFLVEQFLPDEVRVLSRKGPQVYSASLLDHPDWKKYSDALDPGSFWASVGDEWATK